jgi:hypothetical protein
MKKILLLLTLIAVVSSADTTKVLFIGNSYTYVNDLPLLFKNLSASGGKIIYTEMQAPGGYMLENHLATSATLDAIKRGIWDFVILQEQSQTPVIEYLRYHSMYPSAIKLDSIIKEFNPNAVTVFFMTWGRKNGGQQCIDTSCSPVFRNFFHMQDSMKSSYTQISNILSAMLSPAGEAWRTARLIKPGVNLWDADESHPALDGSYLTACVFYAKIFNQSPVSLNYNGGLPDSSALFYRQCAWQTVGVNNVNPKLQGEFRLFQNYPNPFNPVSRIKYQISNSEGRNQNSEVRIIIYDITGKKITTLVNEKQRPGIYEVSFNGSNLASGVYFYRLTVNGNTIDTKKMILLK